MKVLVKRPDEPKGHIEDIPNTLDALQELVGGDIELVWVLTDMVIICNEEGKLQGLPFNMQFLGKDFVGTLVFAGTEHSELADITEDFEKMWREGMLWK